MSQARAASLVETAARLNGAQWVSLDHPRSPKSKASVGCILLACEGFSCGVRVTRCRGQSAALAYKCARARGGRATQCGERRSRSKNGSAETIVYWQERERGVHRTGVSGTLNGVGVVWCVCTELSDDKVRITPRLTCDENCKSRGCYITSPQWMKRWNGHP